MIDLYYWPTPNGHKITIFLEEAGIDYEIKPVDIARGEQFDLDFLEIAPNNRIPAIVDTDPADGGDRLSVFESGAILIYLAEKYGRFLPSEPRARADVLQWLMWQMAGLGPMLGQSHHFRTYAPEKIDYAITRYINETSRLYGVLDFRLTGREFITDEYSIADMAAYPWIVSHENQEIDIAEFPNVKRWFDTLSERPAVQRAYDRGTEFKKPETLSDDAKKMLFGQTATTVRR
ncbi:MAG: glutathione S-transferase N-terminal domain-containing protein [Alphaproteobacteria bacterium]